MQIREAAPEIFEDVQPWLDGIKNPCYKSQNGTTRCLPYLSIIGVSKSGTTDLYRKLMQLPCASPACFDVSFPKSDGIPRTAALSEKRFSVSLPALW